MTYAVAGYDGIAWSRIGPEMVDEFDEDTGENVTEWSGYQVPTGKIEMVMVGDDRVFTFDPKDITKIAEEDYCPGCGQIGCGAYR